MSDGAWSIGPVRHGFIDRLTYQATEIELMIRERYSITRNQEDETPSRKMHYGAGTGSDVCVCVTG